MTKYKCLCRKSSCDKDGLPGDVGMFSDKTLQFVSDPHQFLERTCDQLGSRVFVCRLATKQTIVIADHKLLSSFLASSQRDFKTGLSDFSELFGACITFAEEDTAVRLKQILLPLFSEESIHSFQPALEQELSHWSQQLDCDREINLYEEFKNISLAQNVNIFMGVDRSKDPELFNNIKELASVHWHGFVSLPTNYSIPFMGQGGYKKALEAKHKLLKIIEDQMTANSSTFYQRFQQSKSSFLTEEMILDHMLLFSCALIPKAVGSVLVMFFEYIDKWKHLLKEDGTLDDANLECLLLEVMRLHPPFIGNIKKATVDTMVGDYHCPAGTNVFYSFLGAMRDPAAFLYPDDFMPSRWRDQVAKGVAGGREGVAMVVDGHLAWGGGVHSCVGRVMSWVTVTNIARHILTHYTVTRHSDNLEIKHLPVLRPRQESKFTLKPKHNNNKS